MVRATYDHNRNFGRPDSGDGEKRASFRELFSFTGNNKLGLEITGSPHDNLVSNWPIEWERFVRREPEHPDRLARRIDTRLAHPLSVLLNEGNNASEPAKSILKQLAARNLRRGYRLNIPTAQALIAAVNAAGGGEPIEPLTVDELSAGPAGEAVKDGEFVENTPLWYYILLEAEAKANGAHLGALGSRIVAETLVGLVVNDPDSYWAAGSGGGSWTPDEVPVDGVAVTSLAALLAVAGVLAPAPAAT